MRERPRQAVILAGGRGRRLGPLTDSCPKHMAEFHGRPFLSYLLEMLREQGFEQVLLLLGYLPEATERYCDEGQFGLRIERRRTPAEWETTLRLREALPALEDTFLLAYCDNYWPMRFLRMWQRYQESGRPLAQMTVYDNPDGYSRPNVAVDEIGFVSQYDRNREAPGLHGVDIGYLIMRREALETLRAENTAFEQVLYSKLIRDKKLSAYRTGHRYYGVGTPDRLALTEAFLARPKAVILDRDGVLNHRRKMAEYVESWDHWQWKPGALEGLRMLHEAGYRVIVASNQAGVSRGMVKPAALADIDRRMKQAAAAAGGKIDASYYCPHGWDAGCECRKPRAGMLYQAQRDFHLDLTRTWFVGDDQRDAEAAEAAGCLFTAVGETQRLDEVLTQVMERTGMETERACVS
jgi:histidinol-phosphate phosphatase family protein